MASVPAGLLNYTLTFWNSGNENTTGVLVGDSLPANTSFYAATGNDILMGNEVVWTVGPVNTGLVTTPFPHRDAPR